jgi:O-antigen ligase
MTENVMLALVLAPFVIAVTVVLLARPLTVALPLFAAVLPFGGLLAVGPSRFSSLSSILGLLLVVGLLAQVVAGRRTGVPMSPTVPLWLLFLAVAGATTLWSLDAVSTAVGFVVLGSLSALYILVSMSPIERGVLRRTENGLLVGGVAVTGYGLVQLLLLGGFPAHVPGAPLDAGGRFGNDLLGPDNEAVSLLLPLVIALSRSVARERPRSRTGYAGVAALLLLGVLMTGSRGGILAAVVSGLVLALASRRGRRRLLTYTVVGLMLGAVAFFLHPLGIAERTVATSSSSGRFAIWRVGLAACPHYCAVGSGWETFPLVYAKTQPSVPDAQVLVGKGGSYQPHNVILLVAIELGIAGLILLFAVLAATVVDALRLPVSLRGPPLAGLVGTWFAAMFLSNLEYKFFWMALIMVALSRTVASGEGRGPVVDAGGRHRLAPEPPPEPTPTPERLGQPR